MMYNVIISSGKKAYKTICARMKSDDIFVVGWLNICNPKEKIDDNVIHIDLHCLYKQQDGIYYIGENSIHVENLVLLGVRREWIVNYEKLRDTALTNPLDGLDNHFTGLLMGMSHSQSGICLTLLRHVHYFKLASPSMDLFCHYNFLKLIIDRNLVNSRNLKHIVIELPYYIFNYDLSLFGDFVYTKMKYFDIVNNFHHINDTNCLNEFRMFEKLFFESHNLSESNVSRQFKRFFRRLGFTNIRTIFRAIFNNDKVWKCLYPKTVEENTHLWQLFINLFRQSFPGSTLTVLVMPQNSLFRWTHSQAINQQKRIFYRFINNRGGVEIVDHFGLYNNPCLFSDHCHLTTKGAEKYTRHIHYLFQ